MCQTEKMLVYAKAYTKEVLRRNKEKIVAVYLCGSLSAELEGKIKGYVGKRSDVDIVVLGKGNEHEINWPPEKEWPSICESYFVLEGGEEPTYQAYAGKLIARGHNLNLIKILQMSRDGNLLGLVHNWYPLYEPEDHLSRLKEQFPRASEYEKRQELRGKVFDAYMALDDAVDLCENEKYEDMIFCILDGIVTYAFVMPYLLNIYDTSSKQRFRIIKEASPRIAGLVLEMLRQIAPTRQACRDLLQKSELLVKEIAAELGNLGYRDILAEGKQLAETHRFSSVLAGKSGS